MEKSYKMAVSYIHRVYLFSYQDIWNDRNHKSTVILKSSQIILTIKVNLSDMEDAEGKVKWKNHSTQVRQLLIRSLSSSKFTYTTSAKRTTQSKQMNGIWEMQCFDWTFASLNKINVLLLRKEGWILSRQFMIPVWS